MQFDIRHGYNVAIGRCRPTGNGNAKEAQGSSDTDTDDEQTVAQRKQQQQQQQQQEAEAARAAAAAAAAAPKPPAAVAPKKRPPGMAACGSCARMQSSPGSMASIVACQPVQAFFTSLLAIDLQGSLLSSGKTINPKSQDHHEEHHVNEVADC